MRIGLSGGIGCGKTAALEIFSACGFPTFSADVCSRELLSQAEAVRFVAENFGSECVDSSGVRRDVLANVVFTDSEARERLEGFLHPQIEAAWRAFCEEAEAAGETPVVEIPLLFEKGYEAEFDFTVCVACSRETQLARLAGRGVSMDDAARRIAAQLPLEDKISKADVLLSNDGSLEFLERQIKFSKRAMIHGRLRSQERKSVGRTPAGSEARQGFTPKGVRATDCSFEQSPMDCELRDCVPEGNKISSWSPPSPSATERSTREDPRGSPI